ncbi:apolipoprotein A-II [Cheilinus undulatus]|uniref:apolipoprotein A-II n=1 Tax=Cheilinus undulatus TaxID=241271 RepID=UPI001BD557C2|nr:apolipoprotein A-II [Cheilinus undulatus]
MNAKYVVALILALQVSMSLCEVPQPSAELVEKYNRLRTTFISRIMNLYEKAQAAAAPMVENVGQNEQTTAIREYVEDLQGKPETQAFVKLATALVQEASPMVDRARSALLGLYEQYVRPNYGQTLDDVITNKISPFLDQYFPAPQ